MKLRIDSNGFGSQKGSHVSVFAHLMKGEHDDFLKWPFCADITIVSFRFPEVNGACASQGMRGGSLGTTSFVSHSSLSCEHSLNTNYVENDCLRFQVTVSVLLH